MAGGKSSKKIGTKERKGEGGGGGKKKAKNKVKKTKKLSEDAKTRQQEQRAAIEEERRRMREELVATFLRVKLSTLLIPCVMCNKLLISLSACPPTAQTSQRAVPYSAQPIENYRKVASCPAGGQKRPTLS